MTRSSGIDPLEPCVHIVQYIKIYHLWEWLYIRVSFSHRDVSCCPILLVIWSEMWLVSQVPGTGPLLRLAAILVRFLRWFPGTREGYSHDSLRRGRRDAPNAALYLVFDMKAITTEFYYWQSTRCTSRWCCHYDKLYKTQLALTLGVWKRQEQHIVSPCVYDTTAVCRNMKFLQL